MIDRRSLFAGLAAALLTSNKLLGFAGEVFAANPSGGEWTPADINDLKVWLDPGVREFGWSGRIQTPMNGLRSK